MSEEKMIDRFSRFIEELTAPFFEKSLDQIARACEEKIDQIITPVANLPFPDTIKAISI